MSGGHQGVTCVTTDAVVALEREEAFTLGHRARRTSLASVGGLVSYMCHIMTFLSHMGALMKSH